MDFYHRSVATISPFSVANPENSLTSVCNSAALILDSLDQKKGSVKGLCMAEAKKGKKVGEGARFLKVVVEVLKCRFPRSLSRTRPHPCLNSFTPRADYVVHARNRPPAHPASPDGDKTALFRTDLVRPAVFGRSAQHGAQIGFGRFGQQSPQDGRSQVAEAATEKDSDAGKLGERHGPRPLVCQEGLVAPEGAQGSQEARKVQAGVSFSPNLGLLPRELVK